MLLQLLECAQTAQSDRANKFLGDARANQGDIVTHGWHLRDDLLHCCWRLSGEFTLRHLDHRLWNLAGSLNINGFLTSKRWRK